MHRRWMSSLLVGALALVAWNESAAPAAADMPPLPRYNYYPYYYFPHSYWPNLSPPWPEPPGHPYVGPPAYMAFPPFREPYWRYEYWMPQRYYRGSHFFLDVF